MIADCASGRQRHRISGTRSRMTAAPLALAGGSSCGAALESAPQAAASPAAADPRRVALEGDAGHGPGPPAWAAAKAAEGQAPEGRDEVVAVIRPSSRTRRHPAALPFWRSAGLAGGWRCPKGNWLELTSAAERSVEHLGIQLGPFHVGPDTERAQAFVEIVVKSRKLFLNA